MEQNKSRKELELQLDAVTSEHEILTEEIKYHSKIVQLKLERLKIVRNEVMDVEYQLEHHPDSIWEGSNNAYEMAGNR